jgi:hypothetical protein
MGPRADLDIAKRKKVARTGNWTPAVHPVVWSLCWHFFLFWRYRRRKNSVTLVCEFVSKSQNRLVYRHGVWIVANLELLRGISHLLQGNSGLVDWNLLLSRMSPLSMLLRFSRVTLMCADSETGCCSRWRCYFPHSGWCVLQVAPNTQNRNAFSKPRARLTADDCVTSTALPHRADDTRIPKDVCFRPPAKDRSVLYWNQPHSSLLHVMLELERNFIFYWN